ncbi:hypothetical protein BDV36DRAFT_252191 [Aspergillus pseudocaelatus]|uniref:Uncharacterized protein n=1 Tax=Aspergillus pseudocaelatus TaxID=1825620 RepID=A0ABQ6WQ34_9EURO|nr:hypothetical protein BDV36DRAFT_252191 [Aspergillus pseudocaelatus]
MAPTLRIAMIQLYVKVITVPIVFPYSPANRSATSLFVLRKSLYELSNSFVTPPLKGCDLAVLAVLHLTN